MRDRLLTVGALDAQRTTHDVLVFSARAVFTLFASKIAYGRRANICTRDPLAASAGQACCLAQIGKRRISVASINAGQASIPCIALAMIDLPIALTGRVRIAAAKQAASRPGLWLVLSVRAFRAG